MPTTTQLRDWWEPACPSDRSTIRLFGEGSVNVRNAVIPALAQLDACLRAHNYRTRKDDTGGYNCRTITGGDDYSLHAYGIAVDLNWQTNPYGDSLVTDMPPAMVADIKAVRTRNGKQVWRWGGDYRGNKDAMHFEIVCSPADLATGIATPTEDDVTPEQVEAAMRKVLDEGTGTGQTSWRGTNKAILAGIQANANRFSKVPTAKQIAVAVKAELGSGDSVTEAQIEAAVARVFAKAGS